MKEKNINNIIVAVTFAIATFFEYVLRGEYFFGFLAIVLVIVGMVLYMYPVSAIGFLMLTFDALYVVAKFSMWSNLNIYILTEIAPGIAFAILAYIVYRKNTNSRVLSFVAIGLLIIAFVVNSAFYGSFMNILRISFTSILFIVSYILYGVSAWFSVELPEKPEERTIQKENSSSASIEKLSNLKDLLDKGIISQEEFDEKKKEILG